MTSKGSELPSLVSVPRLTTLFASLLVALSSGTNYVSVFRLDVVVVSQIVSGVFIILSSTRCETRYLAYRAECSGFKWKQYVENTACVDLI